MNDFMEDFEKAGISYQYCLIDDAVSRAVKIRVAMSGPARTTTAML